MLRKLKKLGERLASARNPVSQNDRVNVLVNMGFDESQAAIALEASGGDVDQAAELLLGSLSNDNPTRNSNEVAERRLKKSGVTKSEETQINSMTKMLTPLKNKSKEEQISRLAPRLSSYPGAVDTLRIALTALKNDFSNPKYRTIDKNTAGYQKVLQPVPAAHDLLLAVNFEKRARGKYGILVIEKSQVDMALLWIAITALEKVSETEEYKVAKEKLKFEKQLRALLSVDEINVPEKEIAERLKYTKKLAKEPSEDQHYKEGVSSLHQNIALIHVHLLPEKIVKRRFDGDDQLRDIIFWMGTFDSKIPTKILNGEWCLVDKNTPNSNSIPCDERSLNMTLQRIGCWPSGRLELRQGNGNIQDMDMMELQASTIGLGIAASSDFNKK